MKNGSSDITVVLDRSGSMSSLSDEVIGAFNSFVDEQKQVAGTAVFSLVQFDDHAVNIGVAQVGQHFQALVAADDVAGGVVVDHRLDVTELG